MKQKSLGKQDNLNEKSASTGFPHLGHIWAEATLSRPLPNRNPLLGRVSGEKGASTDLLLGEIHPLLPPHPSHLLPPPCTPPFPPPPLHRSEMLTLQAVRFMNMTLEGKKPSHKPRTMLSSLLRSLKRSREEETPVELQPDCD